METSLLRSTLKSTEKKFLTDVFGPGSEHEQKAREVLFSTILTQGTTLLSPLAKDADAQAVYADETQETPRKRRTTRKGVQERMSRWLAKRDFGAKRYLLANGARLVQDDATIAFDQPDISKEFAERARREWRRGATGAAASRRWATT
jgi:hypothetical protein